MKKIFIDRSALIAAAMVFLGAACCRAVSAADMVVYGDGRTNAAVHRKIIEAIVPFKPVAVFMTGDLVGDGKDPRQWAEFKDLAKPLLRAGVYFPMPSNHDLGGGLYSEAFPFLEGRRWYSMEREGVHFTILDSTLSLKPGSAQYRWLVADLKRAGKRNLFKVIMLHHPLFSVGSHQEDEKELRPDLLPVFRKFGVSAVFAGHDHNYQRLEYEGRVFIVTGGGGAPLYEATRMSPYLKKFRKAYHFCVVTVEPGAMNVRVIDIDGNQVDSFSITGQKQP